MTDKPQNLQDVSAAAFGPGGELDLFDRTHTAPVARAAAIAAIAIAVLALFNAQGLTKWAQGLPSDGEGAWRTRAAESVLAGAERWEGWMNAIGTAQIFDAVRRRFRAFRGE